MKRASTVVRWPKSKHFSDACWSENESSIGNSPEDSSGFLFDWHPEPSHANGEAYLELEPAAWLSPPALWPWASTQTERTYSRNPRLAWRKNGKAATDRDSCELGPGREPQRNRVDLHGQRERSWRMRGFESSLATGGNRGNHSDVGSDRHAGKGCALP